MPRARISVNGPELAKPGYDVDTASLANMIFSPSLVAMRVALTGVVTPVSYTGELNTYYKRSIITLPTPFPYPPVALVAGLNADGSTDQSPIVYSFASAQDGVAYSLPTYEIRSFTDRVELYTYQTPFPAPNHPTPVDWRYWIFANTLNE